MKEIDLDIPRTAAARVARQDAERSCECSRCGRLHHRLAASPPLGEEAAMRAIVALRTPDQSMAHVVNAVRQSIADVIEEQKRQIDRYGLALMMIREGCENPRQFAADMLLKGKA